MSGPYYADDLVTLYLGDCLDVLREMEADSIDAVATDPPYGLEFMSVAWDSFAVPKGAGRPIERSEWGDFGSREHPRTAAAAARVARNKGLAYQRFCDGWAAECLRVLKPGGYLAAFSGTRTYHRMACAIEDAGFEIRDSLHWIYGSGFPKSKASLKPAHEPVVLARKPDRHSAPLPGLDGCRVQFTSEADLAESEAKNRHADFGSKARDNHVFGADLRPRADDGNYDGSAGRWPPNILLTHAEDCYLVAEGADEDDCAPGCPVAELDRQSGVTTSAGGANAGKLGVRVYGKFANETIGTNAGGLGDTGGASRFFPVFKYEPKAGADERPRLPDGTTWPTVKPLDLMRWLVRLVTPTGGTVLDFCAGTGTTGEACVIEGFPCVLIEKDPVAAELITTRLRKPIQPDLFGALDFGGQGSVA